MNNKMMPNFSHLVTPELRNRLSNLGILSNRPSARPAPISPAAPLPKGLSRLEFETFIEAQTFINSLYANCKPTRIDFDSNSSLWVVFVKWEKAV